MPQSGTGGPLVLRKSSSDELMIRICHVSDTHNQPSVVRGVAESDADMLLITGDCISNKLNRLLGEMAIPQQEIRYQDRWLRKQAKKWAQDLRGRPVVAVGGNHDFIPYTPWLRHYGAQVYEITESNPCVELFGLRFAGFREVPFVTGEWMGEVAEFTVPMQRAMACRPDILVTHGPPKGILDRDDEEGEGWSYGIDQLHEVLFGSSHRITHHFFGHAHADGGRQVDLGGIRFINGACHCITHTVRSVG